VTVLLWVGPFAVLAQGFGVMAIVLRRRRSIPAPPPPRADANRARIAALLESDRAPPESGR
jgi:cytochrome c-type biogenesis protein CcmH/NrfF